MLYAALIFLILILATIEDADAASPRTTEREARAAVELVLTDTAIEKAGE